MPSGDRPLQQGYTLVTVVMMIAVISILVTATLPLWSAQIQRDKEEELISRGLQYAEAIRVFQRRFGRLPLRLEELVEAEPRSIRRLWDDPMTGRRNWIPIFEGVPAGGLPIDPQTGLPIPDPDGDGIPGSGETTYVGPIRGVRSQAQGDSIKTFLDQTTYRSWEFRSDIFSRFRAVPSENGVPRVSALTIGRPFRFPMPGGGGGGGIGPRIPQPGVPGTKPAATGPEQVSPTPPVVRVVRLAHGAGLPLPAAASSGSAGADLRAAIEEPVTLAPGARALVPCGILLEIPEGYEGQVRPRSGLAIRHGLTCLNSPGTIDSDYRGEVQVILVNHGAESCVIQRGDRIAQLVIAKVERAEFVEAESLSLTERGEGGFGSSGRG